MCLLQPESNCWDEIESKHGPAYCMRIHCAEAVYLPTVFRFNEFSSFIFPWNSGCKKSFDSVNLISTQYINKIDSDDV